MHAYICVLNKRESNRYKHQQQQQKKINCVRHKTQKSNFSYLGLGGLSSSQFDLHTMKLREREKIESFNA